MSKKILKVILLGILATLGTSAHAIMKFKSNVSSDNNINFQVTIKSETNKCGGSLISQDLVITTKNCLPRYSPQPSTLTVIHDNTGYKVKKIFEADDVTNYANLAILRLEIPVKGNVKFVKIPTIKNEQTAFVEKYPFTVFGFLDDSDTLGYANKYYSWYYRQRFPDSDILPINSCKDIENKCRFDLKIPQGHYYLNPFSNGDKGSAIAYKKGDDYYMVAVIDGSNNYHRLANKRIRDWINTIYITTHHWDENYQKGPTGELYLYDNPYNKTAEYFGLMRLNENKRFGYFPTNKENNHNWTYLGDTTTISRRKARNKLDILSTVQYWDTNRVGGTVGDMYLYNNPYNGETQYFALIALGNDKKYWHFPTETKINSFWSFLGNTTVEAARNKLDHMLSFHQWGENGRKGTIGDNYVYSNKYTDDIEIFTLKALGDDKKYWHFPTNKKDNYYWTYEGLLDDFHVYHK